MFVSNAAGGIRRTFRPGDLMVIADHVNLTGRNPLFGAVEPGMFDFPDMSDPYDPELRAALHQAGKRVGVSLVEGVYGWALGPSYETPAEVRMFERFGLDAIGMSTVPEVIAARAAGMRVAGMSCVTNLACGITTAPVNHEEVHRGDARGRWTVRGRRARMGAGAVTLRHFRVKRGILGSR